jgi:glycerol kinase
MSNFVLAIDQGTTSSRAILFDENHAPVVTAQQEFEQHFPQSGWVEHAAEDIWQTTLSTGRDAIAKAGVTPGQIAAIGITNQRESTVVWDRESGRPLHRVIVWQDRRTADTCAELKTAGSGPLVAARTGLLLDPYFSATKIAWVLDTVDGARDAANAGRLAFGTIDSFLLWRLTDGAVHATDATNASRTLLYDIHKGCWSEELCDLFRVPMSMLPEVRDCADDYGETDVFGGTIAIRGVAGDQQAAAIGQACFQPGMMKATYGTGCFALLNTGDAPVASKNHMLTTVAYRIDGKTTYALEGSIFIAGAAVQWLRDGLGLIEDAAETEALAAAADPNQDVYLVPAFTGLGAPHWRADVRGAMFGLTRATGPREFARAALEAVCYQTRDLLDAMRGDWQGTAETVLRVDGGMVASDWTMQFLADILDADVDRPEILETTALGAAYLAGMGAGVYPGMEEFSSRWRLDKRFSAKMDSETRTRKYAGWRDAVKRIL